MLSVEEAQEKIFLQISPMGAEKVPLSSALGRILSEEIVSSLDHPPWDNSAMDGYAVIASDTRGASHATPLRLTVIETIPAGALPQKKIIPGTASKIMTGAPLPAGADAIIKAEDTHPIGQEVEIYAEGDADFIRRRGEVMQKGNLILKKGVRIRPYEVAILASLGLSEIAVFKRPQVAILSTGNELCDLCEPKGPHQIYNSNSYGLMAQVVEVGGIPIPLGIAKDTRSDLITKLEAASEADFILISGGVSVGDYDFVKEVFSEKGKGGGMAFWRIAMKPGKPLAFGLVFGKPTWGLPGNPVSAMVTFDQCVRPALLVAQGALNRFLPVVQAELMENIQKEAGRRHYIRARLYIQGGRYCVAPTGDQDSANLLSFVEANAYIVIPEGEVQVKAGSQVNVQIIGAIGQDQGLSP